MSEISQRRVRVHALATATALVLSGLVATPAFAGRADLSGLQSAETHDRFIVKYRDGSAQRADVASAQVGISRATGGNAIKLGHVRRMSQGADVVKSERKLDRVEAEALMRQIAADPNVEYVEIDKLNHPLFTPNDTNFSQQFGFGTGAGGTYATQAWDITSGAGSVVAVLDTGITTHSDLAANILPGYDFIVDTAVANDGNGRDSNPADPGDWTTGQCGAASNSSWHGTHVAGTIAAVTNNAKGVAGMAYNAKIVPVRVLGTCGGYDSDIADGMIWASGGTVTGVPANANPAEVINLSLGGSGACSTTTQNAINSAVSRGSTLVIAAGNSNVNVSGASPANCLNVIAVGATTSTGSRSSFSNYGTGIDVAAPGSTIMSTMNAGTTSPGAENYVNYSGTSMATPHVAGIVALMQAVAATPKTPAQIESLLKSTARAFPVAQTQLNGAGIANAKAAVDAAKGTTTPPPTAQTYTNGTDYTISDNVTVDSPVTVSGRSGNAPSTASVSVTIYHTYKGDLKVDLVAPDGSLYNIHNRTGTSTDNVIGTFTKNLSTELLNGTWKLRVNDNAAGDVSRIDTWSITF